jgi:hypothetical protein
MTFRFVFSSRAGDLRQRLDRRGPVFRQNKVQYEKFNFKVKTTEHFDIYYYPEEQQAVELAARMAERWYARLSRVLRHELSSRQPIILYAAHPHFQQTNAIQATLAKAPAASPKCSSDG